MKQMQFAAIVMMTLLTLKLLLLPNRLTGKNIVNRARWLMAAGISLLDVQFILQYKLELRAMGVTQAVMVNILMFIPCSALLSIAIQHLQRQGRIGFWDRWIGLVAWVGAAALMAGAIVYDGQPLLADTPERHSAQVGAALCYFAMQCYYTYRSLINLHAMSRAMHNYYDRDMDGILRWMKYSIIFLAVLAIMAPLLIFRWGVLLAVYSILAFGCIFYFVDSFCSYVVSSAPAKVEEAEKSEEEEESESTKVQEKTEEISENMQRVEKAVAKWKEKGGHLKSGLKLPSAAEGIGVPQYLLSSWLRTKGMKYNEWMTDLRIEEAKNMLLSNREWSNEYIAQRCGFNDRSYFQRKFKERTGISPADFIEHQAS